MRPRRTGWRPQVLLLSQFFPPETGAPANRIGAMAAALQERCDLSVVTLNPSYPAPDHYADLGVRQFDRRQPFSVRRVFTFDAHAGSFIVRGLREVVMSVRMGLSALGKRPDVVIVSSPTMFLGPVGLSLARMHGVPLVWDLRDVTWGYASDWTNASGALRVVAAGLGWFMKGVVRRATLLTVTNEGSRALLAQQGADERRIMVVPNGVSREILDELRPHPSLNGGRRVHLTYAGLVGRNQGIAVLLEVARRLPDIQVDIVGDGPERRDLEQAARRIGLSNVCFTGYVGRTEVYDRYRSSDILFAQLCDTPTLNSSTVPSKLYEYMAAGKPIVYGGKGVAAELVQSSGCGVAVAPGDATSICAAVARLAEDPESRRRMGCRGRQVVEDCYRREALMGTFTSHVLSLCGQ